MFTWLVVTLPRWIREWRFVLRQEHVSVEWIREQRKTRTENGQ